MKRIALKHTALLALLPAVLSLATAGHAGIMPKERHEDVSSNTSDYRPGEDWNDFAVRQGWWGRGRSDKVAPAAAAQRGEFARGSELQSIPSPRELSDER
jgi:hypothetical protein